MAGAGPPDTGATPPPRMVSSGVLPAVHNPLQLQRLHNRYAHKACKCSRPLTYPVPRALQTGSVQRRRLAAGAQCMNNRKGLAGGVGAGGSPDGARGVGADGCGPQELGAPSRPGVNHLSRGGWPNVAMLQIGKCPSHEAPAARTITVVLCSPGRIEARQTAMPPACHAQAAQPPSCAAFTTHVEGVRGDLGTHGDIASAAVRLPGILAGVCALVGGVALRQRTNGLQGVEAHSGAPRRACLWH